MAKEFVHLHVHTEFSLLDGAARVQNLIAAAKNMGASAIAITDHGGMYGVIDFYEAAAREKIKPIIGCEVYVAPKSRLDKTAGVKDNSAGGGPARGGPYHLILLAENNEGYRNLMHLVTLSYMEGFYYRPRVDKELLRRYSSGLVALSGCLKGEISQALLNGGTEKAKKLASEYENIFGKGNFFIEVQDQKMEEQKELNENLVKIARDLEIPIVATNDVHYIKKEESTAQDVLLCIQTGSVLESDDRLKFSTDEFYLKNPEQMRRLFSHLPEALDNTLAIAERCSVSIDFNRVYLPHYEVPDGYDLDSYLEKLCREGLKERYEKITPGIEERLKHELEVIKNKGFSGYFLVVWDFVRHAKSRGIAVGPGRGSAAGSLVAYSLGITNIDPLKYDLLFERFLNPERKSLPDIDIDFDEERRDEVIDYVVNKYGRDKVAQIVTFGTMAARAATRDAGRVFNIPYSRVDKIAKLIPEALDITVEQALNTVPELKAEYETDEKVRQILDTAKVLEGLARHDSIHAAGVVISRDELPNYTPLQRKGEGEVVTQYHMKAVQKIGLLKMDFLGLRTLTVIEKALKIIKSIHGVEIDMDNRPLSDEKTYRMLRKGDSVGVFQLESSGMRGLLKELHPTRFEDIIALLALHRPGPLGSGMVQDFMDRKHGRKKIDYLHPSLKPILEDTYGIIVYQEQVMRIASEMAGFSLAEADILRGAMSKKKHDVMAEQREKFIGGAISKGYDANLASRIFDLVAHFGGYGFNKCLIGGTELIDADTGEIVTVEKLFKRKKLVNTLSCGSDLKMIKRPIIDVVANGVKPVYRVKTQLGREIVVTDNHPFLTIEGWRELKDLFEGERVALPMLQHYFASVAAHRESKDVIPARIKYLIQAEKQELGEIWPEVEFSSNISTRELSGTVKSYKHGFRRRTIGALATYFDSDELRRYASSDIYWDEVVCIEYAGEKPTYDIEVADTHNFVANGIIVHNSHSTAYASISYQTSYLKANYPVEFMAALLTSVRGSKDKVAQYVNECRQLGIKVLPPDVNQSYQDFTVVEGAIRFGLSAVRNVGDNVIEAIIEGRREGEFKSLHDFCRRVNLRVINKRAVESLIKAGAFDFAGTRKHLLSVFEKAMDSGSKVQQDRKIGQFSLFGEEDRMSIVAKEEMEEFPKDQLLSYEKEMLGLYVSDHPLLSVESRLKSQTDVVLSELSDQKDGAIRWVGGIVSRASRTLTKKGEMMLFLTLEDLEGSVEVVIFPSTYQRYRDLLAKDNIVLIKGRVDVKEDGFKVIAQDIKPLDLREEASRPLSLRLTQNGLSSRLIDQLKAILKSHSGPSPVILHIQAGAKLTQLELGNEYRVKRSGALYAELKALLGEKSVIN